LPPAARWLCACFCSISRVILLLVCSPGLSPWEEMRLLALINDNK
jgi:hypothetical protein